MKDDLTLLVDPVYTRQDINKCQTFWWLRKVAEHWLEQGKRRRVYWTVGEGDYDSDLISDPRWIRVPVPRSADRYFEMWFPPHQLRNNFTIFGPYGDWDLLLTTRNNGIFWRRLEPQTRFNKYLCLAEPFPMLPFKKTVTVGGSTTFARAYQLICIQTLSSYAVFDSIHISAKFEQDAVFQLAKDFLSPKIQQGLRKSMVVSHPDLGLPVDYPLTEEARDHFVNGKPVRVIYTHRISETQRRFSKVYETLQKLFARGKIPNLHLQVCTNSLVGEDNPDSKWLVIESLPRGMFYDFLKKSHIFISMSVEEDLPTGLVEASVHGVVGVVPREPWALDMFGRDYPWIASSVTEAYGCVRQIHSNRADAWQKWTNWYRDYLIPVIMKRCDAETRFEDETQRWSDYIDSIVRQRAPMLTEEIHKKFPKGGTIDLMHLPKGFKVTNDIRKMAQETWDHSYFRSPRRWSIGYALKTLYGWKSTAKPWILQK